jgi:hypothetical protein
MGYGEKGKIDIEIIDRGVLEAQVAKALQVRMNDINGFSG